MRDPRSGRPWGPRRGACGPAGEVAGPLTGAAAAHGEARPRRGHRRTDDAAESSPGLSLSLSRDSFPCTADVAQLVAHPTCNRAVRGSSPLVGSDSESCARRRRTACAIWTALPCVTHDDPVNGTAPVRYVGRAHQRAAVATAFAEPGSRRPRLRRGRGREVLAGRRRAGRRRHRGRSTGRACSWPGSRCRSPRSNSSSTPGAAGRPIPTTPSSRPSSGSRRSGCGPTRSPRPDRRRR